MKILILVDDYAGGAGKIAQILGNQFCDQGFDVHFITLYSFNKLRFENKNIIYIDRKLSKGFVSKFSFISNIFWLRKYLKQQSIELAISFITNNNILLGLSVLFNDKVYAIGTERENVLASKITIPWRILKLIAYRRLNKITVQFEIFRKFDNNRYLKKTFVTPNFILKPKIIKSIKTNEYVKFVTCSRLDKIKRIDLMIQLFKEINQLRKRTELHIYGNGNELEKLKKLTIRLSIDENVFIHPATYDIDPILSKSDIYLMTSEQEGFPNSLGEAIAIGLPSISFACHDGISQLVSDGESGFLVKEGDYQSFIKDAIYLIDNPNIRELFGTKARVISNQFSISEVMKIWNSMI